MNHCRVTATTLGCDHTPGGAILFPGVLIDIVHPEWRLLVIAEAQLAPEHVEDVLVLHHGVALQTAGARASATDPLPDIGVCKRVLSYHYRSEEWCLIIIIIIRLTTLSQSHPRYQRFISTTDTIKSWIREMPLTNSETKKMDCHFKRFSGRV